MPGSTDTRASAVPIRRSIASTPVISPVWMTTSAAVTPSTGSAIITSTRMLRPRPRTTSRRATRSAGAQPRSGLTG